MGGVVSKPLNLSEVCENKQLDGEEKSVLFSLHCEAKTTSSIKSRLDT